MALFFFATITTYLMEQLTFVTRKENKMTRETVELIEEKIANLAQATDKLAPGSEEHVKATEGLKKMSDILDNESKNEMTYLENQLKEIEMRNNNKHQYIRSGIEVFGVIAPIVFYGIWMKKGLKFEETGTLTSFTLKGLINNFKPKRK